MSCQAYRVNDEYHCGKCAVQWATDDTDPSVCNGNNRPWIRRLITELERQLEPTPVFKRESILYSHKRFIITLIDQHGNKQQIVDKKYKSAMTIANRIIEMSNVQS